MVPVIHCVRHGQGFHNLGAGSYTLPDPILTPLGEEQCHSLRKTSFPDQSNISLIVASPMSRALHTAYLTFNPALTSNGAGFPRVLAIPDAQETSDDPCDIGSDRNLLHETVVKNNWPIDLSLLEDGWNVKALGTRYSPQSSAIEARARDTRIFLRRKIRELVKNGDVHAQVVLVTHGSFLHYFTDDWEDAWQYPGTGWYNGETRSYVFSENFMTDEEKEAKLVETMESRQKRGKPAHHRGDQCELFKLAMECWEAQGLQRPDALATAHN